jgi:two-component system sensor histidine kinase TctE
VVSNLIDNSIKYTERAGHVSLSLQGGEGGAEPAVEDSTGIPLEGRQRVFHRFYRRESTVIGKGLGLAIAREIATRHEASIVLETSKSLGGLSARVLFTTSSLGRWRQTMV